MPKVQRKVYVCSSSPEFGSSTSGVRGELLRTLRQLVGAENVSESPLTGTRTGKNTSGRRVRNLMGRCDCVMCLVGFRFGAEPATRPANAPRRSYTQLEYDLARRLGKRVIPCVADRSWQSPLDNNVATEDAQRAALQLAFRDEATRGDVDYIEFSTLSQLRFESCSLISTATAQGSRHETPAPIGQLCRGSELWVTRTRDALVATEGGGAMGGLEQAQARKRLELLGAERSQHSPSEQPSCADHYRVLVRNPRPSESLAQSISKLVGPLVLNLETQDESHFEALLSAGVEWLRYHPDHFLVLNNCDPHLSQRVVVEFLSEFVAGDIVLTRPIQQPLADVEPLDLGVFGRQTASAYLLESTASRRIPTRMDANVADQIAQVLDGVTYSIELAIAYINSKGISLPEYLKWWRYQRKRTLEEDLLPELCCPMSFGTTLRTTYNQLSEPAQRLLRFAATLADAPIPRLLLESPAVADWLRSHFDCVAEQGEPEPDDCRGISECEKAVAELLQYGMLQPAHVACQGNDCRPSRVVLAVKLPNLARQWVRHCTPSVDPCVALAAVQEILPVDPFDHRVWPLWNVFRPHVKALLATLDVAANLERTQKTLIPASPPLERKEETEFSDRLLAGLTTLSRQLGRYLHGIGEYAAAERLLHRAFDLQHQLTGPDGMETARALEDLASLCLANGQPARAEEYVRRSLRIKESRLHMGHPSLADPLHLLGLVLQERGKYMEAESNLRRALTIRESQGVGSELDIAESLSGIASLLLDQARFHEAEALYRQSLAMRRDHLAPKHPLIAMGLDRIAWALQRRGNYDEAERMLRESLQLREWAFGPEHPWVSISLNNLALLLVERGDRDAAEPLYYRSLRIKEQRLHPLHPDRAVTLDNLAGLLKLNQKFAESESFYRQALGIREAALGSDHPDLSITLNNFGLLLVAQGRYEEAANCYRRSLQIKERSLGESHVDIATTMENLAEVLRLQQQYAEAESLFLRALQIRQVTPKSHYLDTATTLNNLGVLYDNQGRLGDAERLYLQSLDIKRSTRSTPYVDIAITIENLGRLLQRQRRFEESEQYFRAALEVREAVRGAQHPEVAVAWLSIGSLLQQRDEYDEAETLYRKALHVLETWQPLPTLVLATTCLQLAELLRLQKKYDESEQLFRRAVTLRTAVLGIEHPEVATAYNNLAVLLVERGSCAVAEVLYRSCIAIKEKVQPIDGPDLAITVGNLAHLLLAQHRHAEAESLLWRVLQLREPSLGTDHVDIIPTLYSLAIASWHQGNFRQAESVISRVLRITERAFGATDQRMAIPLSILARVLQVQRRLEECRRTMEQFVQVIDQLPSQAQLDLADMIHRSIDLLALIGQTTTAARLTGLLTLARERN